jgi:cytochrome P450
VECSCGKLKRCTKDTVWKKGNLLYWIVGLTQVGPIVRINPRELHIRDPGYYEEIYASGTRRREKDPHFTPAFLSPQSMLSTVDHDHHRIRKGFLKNFFSRRSLEPLAPFIQESVRLLCQKLERAHEKSETVRLDSLYADLTADTITHYSFGESYNYLLREAKQNDIQHGAHRVANGFHVNRFFPVFRRILSTLPISVLKLVFPRYAESLVLLSALGEKSKIVLEGAKDKATNETIFDALSNASIPPEERTVSRLVDEGFVVLAAGTITTARTLAMASFHMFSKKAILEKMREELQGVMPRLDSQPSWAELERLPYLVSVRTHFMAHHAKF